MLNRQGETMEAKPTMRHTPPHAAADSAAYPEQFEGSPDLLHIAIPRSEIIGEMAHRGSARTLEDVCFAVAITAQLLGAAMQTTAVHDGPAS
jgi:hypothetical protein